MPGIDEIVRVGKVVSVDEANHTVRVEFTDRGEMVSYDLPVLVSSTIDPQDYELPAEKTDVVCIFLPNGQQQGFILGAYYTGANPPPVKDRKMYLRKFDDGTEIVIDRGKRIVSATDSYGSSIKMQDGDIVFKAARNILMN